MGPGTVGPAAVVEGTVGAAVLVVVDELGTSVPNIRRYCV